MCSTLVPTFLQQLLLLFLLVLLMALCISRRTHIFFYCVLLCATGMTLLIYSRYVEESRPVAFVKHDEITVYTGPDSTYGIVAVVKQGTRLSIVSQHDLWYCVAFDHQRGWVAAKDVDLVV
jgi:uncharacterized protein YgiM (DUF1202 family)